MPSKSTAAAIRVQGKVYTAKHHQEAIDKAEADGKDISKVDREKDGLFQVSDGRLISREQAGKEFGITHSEELWSDEEVYGKKKGLNFLVIDAGIFTSMANALAMGGLNRVYYHVNWSGDAFPKLQDYSPGTGFEYLIKIKRLYTEIDFNAPDAPTVDEDGIKIDCVVNFDVGRNDEIDDIRRRYPNLSVVGSGVGEILEEDRVGLKKICKRLGLDVNDYVVKKGIDSLAEYSKSNKDIYAKIDIFRQSMETIHISNFKDAEKDQIFEKLKVEFGPVFSKTVPFLVEKAIPSDVEGGFDGWFNPANGWMGKCFCGYEIAKGPYLTRVRDYDDLPLPIKKTMDSFIPVLNALDYRGFVSTEEKIMKDGKHYLLDWCSRLLNPGSALYPYAISNWDELNYNIGLNKPCIAKTEFKYYGALPLWSEEGKTQYVHIKVDKGYEKQILFMGVCSDGEDYYSIKGKESMVTLVSGSNSWQDVIEQLKELLDHVSFEGMEKSYASTLDRFPKLIKEGAKLGLDF